MRALFICAFALISLSVALGLRGYAPLGLGLSKGGQLGSFKLDRKSMMQWFCGKDDCGSFEDMHGLQKSMLLKGSQSLHQFLNNKEQFPLSLPSPLNKLQGTQAPKDLQEVHDLFVPVHEAHLKSDQYPYFGFLPIVDGQLIPNGQPVTYSTDCFGSVTATASWNGTSSITVNIATSDRKNNACEDDMIILGGGVAFGVHNGEHLYTYNLDVSGDVEGHDNRKWILNNRGILVGRFPSTFLDAALDLISTVVMLIGFALPKVSGAVFDANTHFVQDYVAFNGSRMGPYNMRYSGAQVAENINPDYIQSGDIFMIIRPDGLDPMIAWAEGGSVGHTTVAMRAPNGTLYVCESTTKDAYWPTNGIQCHEWYVWWRLANTAQYNAVLLPLAPEVKAAFNTSAAWDFFYENEGLNYGYLVLLSGWLDMKHGDQNSPCLPPYTPDNKLCFTRPIMERVLLLIDEFMANSPINLVRQMFSHRVGAWPKEWSAAESVKFGQENLGMNTISDLYSVVEQDDWRYNTTRYGQPTTGRSMVCNVFVCHMLKAGGVFDSINRDIQCGESNLWTLYSSNIWDANKMGANRPEVCKTADPDNLLCQITGNWTLNLHPDLNSRAIYANMSNHCPSIGPNYHYPKNC